MVINVADAISAYKQTGAGTLANDSEKKLVGGEGEASGAGSFADTLMNFVGDGIGAVKNAEKLSAAGAAGKANLQDVILAVNNAEVMMQTVTALRDKVIGAYQDIIRMPI